MFNQCTVTIGFTRIILSKVWLSPLILSSGRTCLQSYTAMLCFVATSSEFSQFSPWTSMASQWAMALENLQLYWLNGRDYNLLECSVPRFLGR